MIRKTIMEGGTRFYESEDKLHNPHRYAIEYDYGENVYYLNGVKQNIVGPQRIYKDNSKEYFINSKRIW